MKLFRLRMDFSRLTDAALEAKVQAIVQAMNLNIALFADPNPTMANLSQATTAFVVALSKAATRDKGLVAIKDEKRLELEQMLSTLAAFVMNVAGNNESTLVLSGFDLVKQATAKPPIQAPENFALASGLNEGEIIATIKRVDGARSYQYEVTPDPLTPDSQWETTSSTLSKNAFANLEPGKKYWFRVAAVGPRKQVTYTNNQARIAV
jgi:hypothetical protein